MDAMTVDEAKEALRSREGIPNSNATADNRGLVSRRRGPIADRRSPAVGRVARRRFSCMDSTTLQI
jgi:hypothetical protein